jgi:predicted MFS family arabinose efflux permease
MTIYWVVLMSVLSQAGFSGSRVAVSLYALELGADQLTVGVIIGLYAICPMLLSIYIGRFADRTSPRLPVIAGSIALVAAMMLPSLAEGLAPLAVVAFVLGLSHLVFSIPIDALVGGIGGPEKRASNYTLITMGWSIANMSGPIMAGLLIDSIGHVQVFLVLAAFVGAPLLILWLRPNLLPREAAHRAESGSQGGSVADLWRIRPLRTIIIASGVVGSAQDLFQFYMPIYGHAIGLSASAIGVVLGMVALASFVVRSFIPFLVKRMPEVTILTLAVFLSAFAFVLMPFFVNAYALGTLAFALGLGVGCALPLTLSLLYLLSPPGRIAEAIGLHRMVRNTTHLVVPIVFGSVGAAFGYFAVFLSNAAALAGSGMLMRRAQVPEAASGPK